MNLSLAITTFNRLALTIDSFAQVIDDPRIDDIIVLDDCSTDGSYEKLVEHYKDITKVRVIRQAQNRGMSQNKRDAIGYAKNEWAILFDSDNVIGLDYLDAFWKDRKEHEWAFDKDNSWPELGNETMHPKNIIFCPSYAKPEFDYRKYENFNVNKGDAAKLIKEDMFNTCMNTCNYIVNRNFYLKTYQHNPAHIASDTIWHAYNHLKAGGSFYIVPEMHYLHRVHKGSGFMQDINYNMSQSEKVRKMIMAL